MNLMQNLRSIKIILTKLLCNSSISVRILIWLTVPSTLKNALSQYGTWRSILYFRECINSKDGKVVFLFKYFHRRSKDAMLSFFLSENPKCISSYVDRK